MPAGRPTKYEPEYAERVYEFMLLGATMEEIAELLDVNVDTIYEWKKIYPEFSESLKNGGRAANAKVAKSLYRRATGFDVSEVTFEKIKGKEGLEVDETGDITEGDQWKVKVTKKQIAPDTAAAIIWLKNREPEKWRDKQVIEQSGPNGEPVKVEHVIKFEDMGDTGNEIK